MRPVQYAFQKLSRTEQRKEGVAAYLWFEPMNILTNEQTFKQTNEQTNKQTYEQTKK